MRDPDLTQDQADRLVEALIDDVLTQVCNERQGQVDRSADGLAEAQRALASAQRALGESRRTRAGWQQRRELDYLFGGRVVMHAKLADFSSSAPTGTHVRAVKSYFDRHPPVFDQQRLLPPPSRLRKLLRRR